LHVHQLQKIFSFVSGKLFCLHICQKRSSDLRQTLLNIYDAFIVRIYRRHCFIFFNQVGMKRFTEENNIIIMQSKNFLHNTVTLLCVN
jgi:hypothetical protein